MPAVTLGNLIHQDEFSDAGLGYLSEYTRPPDVNNPVQTFSDAGDVFGVIADQVTQTLSGDYLVAFESFASFDDIPRINTTTVVVDLFITGANLWAGTTNPSNVYRSQVDSSNRFVLVYDDNGQLHARRVSGVGVVIDTIVLENPTSSAGIVAAVAIDPTGQYVYALLIDNPSGPPWDARLYRYDLDDSGTRTLLKTYTLTRATNPTQSGGLGLGCHIDGTLYVGYFTVVSVPCTPPEDCDEYTYWIDKLDASGTVLDTWQIHQYTNLAQPLGATASNDGFGTSFTTNSLNELWGFFYRHSGFDTSSPSVAESRVLKVDLTTGTPSFSAYSTSQHAGGRFVVLWPYGPREVQAAHPFVFYHIRGA